VRQPEKPTILENRRQESELLLEGLPSADVAHRHRVNCRSVRRWKGAFVMRGERGLRVRPNSGRPPRLNEKRRQRLEQLLLKRDRGCGIPTDLWTCPRISLVIHEHFDVRHYADYISLLMYSQGCPLQNSERQCVERDEKRIPRGSS